MKTLIIVNYLLKAQLCNLFKVKHDFPKYPNKHKTLIQMYLIHINVY